MKTEKEIEQAMQSCKNDLRQAVRMGLYDLAEKYKEKINTYRWVLAEYNSHKFRVLQQDELANIVGLTRE